MKYSIKLSLDAKADIRSYIFAIYYDYSAPSTAARIHKQLLEKIDSLQSNPGIYKIRTEPWYWKYGHFVRRLNFKSLAIIFTIEDDVVFIHRIVTQSEIAGEP